VGPFRRSAVFGLTIGTEDSELGLSRRTRSPSKSNRSPLRNGVIGMSSGYCFLYGAYDRSDDDGEIDRPNPPGPALVAVLLLVLAKFGQ
jgi:hypothetical protein